jgi:hypothetical protein
MIPDQLHEYTYRQAEDGRADERVAQQARHVQPLERDLVLQRHLDAIDRAVRLAHQKLEDLGLEDDEIVAVTDDIWGAIHRARGDVVRQVSALDFGRT